MLAEPIYFSKFATNTNLLKLSPIEKALLHIKVLQ